MNKVILNIIFFLNTNLLSYKFFKRNIEKTTFLIILAQISPDTFFSIFFYEFIQKKQKKIVLVPF